MKRRKETKKCPRRKGGLNGLLSPYQCCVGSVIVLSHHHHHSPLIPSPLPPGPPPFFSALIGNCYRYLPPPPAPYPPSPPPTPPRPTTIFFPSPDRKLLLLSPLLSIVWRRRQGNIWTRCANLVAKQRNGDPWDYQQSNSSFFCHFLFLFYNTFHPICSECKATLGADVQTGIIDFKLTHQLIDDKKFQPLRSFRLRLPKRGKIQQQQQQQKETKKRVLNESKELNVLPIHNVFLFIISVFYCWYIYFTVTFFVLFCCCCDCSPCCRPVPLYCCCWGSWKWSSSCFQLLLSLLLVENDHSPCFHSFPF